jgi:hypothetical protein
MNSGANLAFFAVRISEMRRFILHFVISKPFLTLHRSYMTRVTLTLGRWVAKLREMEGFGPTVTRIKKSLDIFQNCYLYPLTTPR